MREKKTLLRKELLHMPIGVPRIIYCWGEELPPQWTDIYNFIFRRRMVFLMQYLDDELCNQICGLLINIHMEDRSKELEKKEIEKSAMASPLKSAGKSGKDSNLPSQGGLPPGGTQLRSKNQNKFLGLSDGKNLKKDKSMEDLLSSYGNSLYEEDLAIDENYTLEQYTLQKITLEWLNWNAQFFDYSDEPYLFYLAEILSKDFTNEDTQLWLRHQTSTSPLPSDAPTKKTGQKTIQAAPPLLPPYNFKGGTGLAHKNFSGGGVRGGVKRSSLNTFFNFSNLARGPHPQLKKKHRLNSNMSYAKDKFQSTLAPFRSILNLANLISNDMNFSLKKILLGPFSPPVGGGSVSSPPVSALQLGSPTQSDLALDSQPLKKGGLEVQNGLSPSPLGEGKELLQQFNQFQQKPGLAKLIGVLASKEFLNKKANTQKQLSVANKVLGQRNLRKEYALDNKFLWLASQSKQGTLLASQSKGQNWSGEVEKEIGFDAKGVRGRSKGQKGQSGDRSQKQLFSSAVLPLGDNRENKIKALNYLDFDSTNSNQSYAETLKKNAKNKNDYSMARKQTKRALQDEESKKVFVIINSFGGSVGNGITVHDALQFIKAGSLTLGLGVAASAASLVLAGGTISERYVTEGCHVMLHQPEGGINGQASDIWIDSQEIMKIRLDVAEIYSLSAHRPRHKILRDLDRDFYLTATETIHYGLADEIATNEVMHDIIEMTNKVWDVHDSKQQRLLETRESANSGLDTQTQS